VLPLKLNQQEEQEKLEKPVFEMQGKLGLLLGLQPMLQKQPDF
jgi:hypothetical protein